MLSIECTKVFFKHLVDSKEMKLNTSVFSLIASGTVWRLWDDMKIFIHEDYKIRASKIVLLNSRLFASVTIISLKTVCVVRVLGYFGCWTFFEWTE